MFGNYKEKLTKLYNKKTAERNLLDGLIKNHKDEEYKSEEAHERVLKILEGYDSLLKEVKDVLDREDAVYSKELYTSFKNKFKENIKQ